MRYTLWVANSVMVEVDADNDDDAIAAASNLVERKVSDIIDVLGYVESDVEIYSCEEDEEE